LRPNLGATHPTDLSPVVPHLLLTASAPHWDRLVGTGSAISFGPYARRPVLEAAPLQEWLAVRDVVTQ